MDFRIADTFTDSLARLTGEEQKLVKTTAFDLQLNPANPGMSFHRVESAKDKHFWSVRVGSDIRLIVHRQRNSLLLCYVNHHDKAYEWAERRKLETHPATGAAQLVEIRETVKEVVVPVYVQSEDIEAPLPTLFADRSDDELLAYGVPREWLGDVRDANEYTILLIAERLPAEAAEALLELATGGVPRVARLATPPANPFDHPDARRRFRVMANMEELRAALEAPWDRWTVFLHPEQRQLVERDYTGPARVSGSAGTGKTIVALHRAVHLARAHPNARVLLTTISSPLANALRGKLRRLVRSEPRLAERIDVHSLDAISLRLYQSLRGQVALATPEMVREALREIMASLEATQFSLRFLLSEWEDVVDAWQLKDWDAYRDVARLGRKTRLREEQRRALWSVFERLRSKLTERGLTTLASLQSILAEIYSRKATPFDFAVVDESQDVSVSAMRLLAALGGNRPNSLFFAGDLGQRIFQQPFSWRSLGIEVRGRSHNLRVNYRTSHQIRSQADRLLGPQAVDVDGNTENRSDTISLFNGPAPVIGILPTEAEENKAVADWIKTQSNAGVLPHEFGVFVRSDGELRRALDAIEQSGLTYRILGDDLDASDGSVSVGTMHLAKGLEFRAVAVMACDDEVLPLQTRIESVGDDADLQEIYDTERHLLYVACTRARDYLLVTSVNPASEFLDDLRT